MSVRFVIVLLSTLAPLIMVSQRYNMSIAIIAMVNNTAFVVPESDASEVESSNCPVENVNRTREFPEGKLLWSPSEQGIILSAYFYGYTATQIIGGRLAERLGGKITCGSGVLLGSLATFITPFTADNFVLIFIVRLLVGAFHGFIFSSLYSVFNKWIPENEKATAIGSMMAGGNLGGAISLPLVSFICSSTSLGGWPASFFLIASFGVLWSIVWFVFMTDLPEKHSRVTEKELKLIKESTNNQTKTLASIIIVSANTTLLLIVASLTKSPNVTKHVDNAYNTHKTVPWFKLMCSSAVVASLVAKSTGTFSYYILTTELPLYLENVLNVPIKDNGFFNSYVYLVVTVTLYMSGRIADFIKSKNVISTTLMRKIFQAIAFLGLILLALIPFAGCDKRYVFALIVFAMGVYGFIGGGELPIVPEFAPNYSATVFGFANLFASITGILAPVYVGFLLNENIHDREKWNIVFNTCAGLSAFGLIFFSIFATAVPTKWA